MEMGYGMGGIEKQIETLAKEVSSRFDEITYVEIGVAKGVTLSAVALALAASGKKWRAIGVELPDGYSFDRNATVIVAKQRHLTLEFVTPNGTIAHPRWNQITVYLKDSQSFLTELWQEPVNFALIDGCHGKPCVIQDFLAIEAFAVPESVVMFHDFGDDQRGQSQPHCPSGADVNGACYELGLLTGKRKGWKFNEMMAGNRAKGGWDMGVFEKVKDGELAHT